MEGGSEEHEVIKYNVHEVKKKNWVRASGFMLYLFPG